MEYLDIYDENKNYLGKEERKIVHQEALWHNTVHCWLYDELGNIYFQIRNEEGTLYTTASGHVKSGESIKEAFGREINEEIGLNINYDKAELLDVVKFQIDIIKKDGSLFRDRAFANVYAYKLDLTQDYLEQFKFDSSEIKGLVKVDAGEVKELFEDGQGQIVGKVIKECDNKNTIERQIINFDDFLVNKGETAIKKYGDVLNKIIERTCILHN